MREVYEKGPDLLFNKETREFCRHHNNYMDLYYLAAEEIGAYLLRADIDYIEISGQIPINVRNYFLSCMRTLEAASDSFDIGGAL